MQRKQKKKMQTCWDTYELPAQVVALPSPCARGRTKQEKYFQIAGDSLELVSTLLLLLLPLWLPCYLWGSSGGAAEVTGREKVNKLYVVIKRRRIWYPKVTAKSVLFQGITVDGWVDGPPLPPRVHYREIHFIHRKETLLLSVSYSLVCLAESQWDWLTEWVSGMGEGWV